jgi:hypothetical protein
MNYDLLISLPAITPCNIFILKEIYSYYEIRYNIANGIKIVVKISGYHCCSK